jgi:circadian clock protein KaiC
MGPDVIKAGEFDLSGMLAGIKAEARGARRIVFDAVDALLSLLDDPLAERREIYRLDDWLSESGLTGIITAKSQGDDRFGGEGYGFMQCSSWRTAWSPSNCGWSIRSPCDTSR